MAAVTTLERTFRSYVDLTWDPAGEVDSLPLSAIARRDPPFAGPTRVEYRAGLSPEAGPEMGPHTPFGYQYAVPAGDPEITAVPMPRMGSHGYIYHKTTCNSHPWLDSLCYHD